MSSSRTVVTTVPTVGDESCLSSSLSSLVSRRTITDDDVEGEEVRFLGMVFMWWQLLMCLLRPDEDAKVLWHMSQTKFFGWPLLNLLTFLPLPIPLLVLVVLVL